MVETTSKGVWLVADVETVVTECGGSPSSRHDTCTVSSDSPRYQYSSPAGSRKRASFSKKCLPPHPPAPPLRPSFGIAPTGDPVEMRSVSLESVPCPVVSSSTSKPVAGVVTVAIDSVYLAVSAALAVTYNAIFLAVALDRGERLLVVAVASFFVLLTLAAFALAGRACRASGFLIGTFLIVLLSHVVAYWFCTPLVYVPAVAVLLPLIPVSSACKTNVVCPPISNCCDEPFEPSEASLSSSTNSPLHNAEIPRNAKTNAAVEPDRDISSSSPSLSPGVRSVTQHFPPREFTGGTAWSITPRPLASVMSEAVPVPVLPPATCESQTGPASMLSSTARGYSNAELPPNPSFEQASLFATQPCLGKPSLSSASITSWARPFATKLAVTSEDESRQSDNNVNFAFAERDGTGQTALTQSAPATPKQLPAATLPTLPARPIHPMPLAQRIEPCTLSRPRAPFTSHVKREKEPLDNVSLVDRSTLTSNMHRPFNAGRPPDDGTGIIFDVKSPHILHLMLSAAPVGVIVCLLTSAYSIAVSGAPERGLDQWADIACLTALFAALFALARNAARNASNARAFSLQHGTEITSPDRNTSYVPTGEVWPETACVSPPLPPFPLLRPPLLAGNASASTIDCMSPLSSNGDNVDESSQRDSSLSDDASFPSSCRSKGGQLPRALSSPRVDPNNNIESALTPRQQHEKLRDTIKIQSTISQKPPFAPGIAKKRRSRPNLQTKTTEWRKGCELGRGAFGTVSIGLNETTGQLMAVKTIQFGTKDADVQHRIAMLANEIAVMKVLQHPNIVAYYFTERSGNAMNIFMEYVPGGSLLQLLKQFGPLGDVVASAYTEQILLGLAYLHRQGVVHRDIKCANILLTTEGLCKLADFGSAVQLSVVKQDSALRGTPVWMAPEVLMEQPHDWRCDIWSLGCTVMEMFTASLPFAHYNKSPLATLQAIVKDRLRLPDMLSKASKSFLTTCLVKKPELRPSAEDLIPHPWVQQDIDAIALNNKSDTMSCTSKLSRTSTVTSRCSARYVDALRGVPLKASEKEQEAMRKRRIGVLKADIEKRASLMQAPKNVSTVVTAKQFDVEELDPILKMVLGEKDAGEETVFAVSPKFHRLVSLSGTAATARHLVPADSNTSKTSA